MKSQIAKFLKVLLSLLISVASIGSLQSAQAITNIVTVTFHFTDKEGNPVSLGKVSWASTSGFYKSTSSKVNSALGYVTFPYVAEGPTEITLKSARLQNGTWVAGMWFDVDVRAGQVDLVVPEEPTQMTTKYKVQFPDGTPVPGAVVHFITNFAGTVMGTCDQTAVVEFNLPSVDYPDQYPGNAPYERFKDTHRGFVQNGHSECIAYGGSLEYTTDGYGEVTISGYMTPRFASSMATSPVYATYSDPEFSQRSESILPTLGADNIITLGYMPFVTVLDSELDADKNAIVAIPVELGSPSVEPSFVHTVSRSSLNPQIRAAALATPKITIVPPSASKQAACGSGKTKLSASLNALGKATLKVCANASGKYLVKAKGAVGAGAIVIHVKKSAPMRIQDLHAESISPKSATVAWNAPEFDGGKSISSYVVTLKSKFKTVTKTINSGVDFANRTTTVTGLTSDISYTVSVIAKNSYGSSSSQTTAVVVK